MIGMSLGAYGAGLVNVNRVHTIHQTFIGGVPEQYFDLVDSHGNSSVNGIQGNAVITPLDQISITYREMINGQPVNQKIGYGAAGTGTILGFIVVTDTELMKDSAGAIKPKSAGGAIQLTVPPPPYCYYNSSGTYICYP